MIQTEHFTDWDKLNLAEFVDGGLVLARANFRFCPRCLKKQHTHKSGQKMLKNNHLML